MLDREYRAAVRKELQGCKLDDLGIIEISELKERFERYCYQGGFHRGAAPLMTSTMFARFVRDHCLLEGGAGVRLTSGQVDLIFVDIAKHSKRPVIETKNVHGNKMKLGWPDFLDCLCELAHQKYPALPLREGGVQELLLDIAACA